MSESLSSSATPGLGAETAVLHVLNREFLRPLRVLRASLREHGALQNCPTIVVTDDAEVANDPFVRHLAHDIEHISPREASVFSTIRPERIAEGLRTSFAPKYTFLKLLMFKQRGYERHVFLDADMLCLTPMDDALLAAPYDVKAVREMGATAFPTARETPRAPFPQTGLAWVREHGKPSPAPVQGINSGFVVLQGKAIDDGLFEQAIELGTQGAFPNEQSLTTEVIRQGRLSFLRLPLWYNARRRIFASLGEEFFEEVRERVVLLHYTPGKPWKMSDEEFRSYDVVWRATEERARAADGG